MMSLGALLPDDDYHFQMRFERGESAEFFAHTAQHDAIVKQRRHWLDGTPETYAALLPEAIPSLSETVEMAHAWHGFTKVDGPSDWEQCLALGEFWEADFLLLKADADGEIRLYGGCLCFPSSWRLTDKIGKPIEFIHGPVPGLNESIGPGIHKFLAGLKPGAASLRHNWGLARSAELNHHPDRSLPRLDADTPADEVWLRVEHQALVALPQSGGILFGIRVVNHAFAEVCADPMARARLRRALETMPDDVASYKGLATIRPRLADWLAA